MIFWRGCFRRIVCLCLSPQFNITDQENAEQEKKYLAPLLSKFHVSPASTESLLRSLYDEVSLAVEDKKMALDATGRNALYKIHVSLGKIVNSMNEKDKEKDSQGLVVRGRGKSSVVPSVEVEDASGEEEDEKTVIEKAEGDEDEGTIIGHGSERRSPTRDSLVEELLSDGDGEDVEMSGM